jgi:hypothetical protein
LCKKEVQNWAKSKLIIFTKEQTVKGWAVLFRF